MSGFIGIVNPLGAPTDPSLLLAMAKSLRFRGPDGFDGAVGHLCAVWFVLGDDGLQSLLGERECVLRGSDPAAAVGDDGLVGHRRIRGSSRA